jgi:hypothetical protein
MSMKLCELEGCHEVEPVSLVFGVAGGEKLHGAAFIYLVHQGALVAGLLDNLRSSREPQEPLDAVELQARALGQRLGGELLCFLEAHEPKSSVQGRQVVPLEVLH